MCFNDDYYCSETTTTTRTYDDGQTHAARRIVMPAYGRRVSGYDAAESWLEGIKKKKKKDEKDGDKVRMTGKGNKKRAEPHVGVESISPLTAGNYQVLLFDCVFFYILFFFFAPNTTAVLDCRFLRIIKPAVRLVFSSCCLFSGLVFDGPSCNEPVF